MGVLERRGIGVLQIKNPKKSFICHWQQTCCET